MTVAPQERRPRPTAWRLLAATAASAGSLLLWELLLARVFAVVLFADLAHLALGAAMLGLTLGALATSWVGVGSDADLRRRVGALLVLQALAVVATVWVVLALPVLHEGPGTFYTRDSQRFALLNPWAFALLNGVLPLPAAFSGALVALVLRRPRLSASGYAADLGAAGLAAAAFVPLCGIWAAPDLSFLAAAVAALGALTVVPRLAVVPLLAAVAATLLSLHKPLLPIRHAAGWPEGDVFAERWTGTARYTLAHNRANRVGDGNWLLVDNGSASGVVTEPWHAKQLAAYPNRGLVHALHGPGRVAVPAAGAGPEVAVALMAGHTEVVAVELDRGMVELLDERYPGAHPLADPRVTMVAMDGRAAIRQQEAAFDIVHLVWANFFGAAGRIQAAWTPQLLYTREAFGTWLDALSPDGTLSMSGPSIGLLAETARAALVARGVPEPDPHLFWVDGSDGVLLVKPRPFTAAERRTLAAWLARSPRPRSNRSRSSPIILTDNKPYPDHVSELFEPGGAVRAVYRAMVWGLGLTLLGLGAVVVGTAARNPPRRAMPELLFAACLGYGYLALQVVLLHQVVLYVGHPTLAFATVLGSMLLGSGLGGLWVSGTSTEALPSRLRLGLVGVVVGGLVLVLATDVAGDALLAWSTTVRVAVVGLGVGVLGFFAGLPMPSALRLRGQRHARLTPLLWAVNGWASVLAATLATFLARLAGHDAALSVALVVYGVALAVSWRWGSRP